MPDDEIKKEVQNTDSSKSEAKIFPQFVAAISANLLWFCAGCMLTWSSPATPLLGLKGGEAAWVGSLLPLGAALGGPPCGMLVNRLGRKPALLCLALPVLAGWALVLASTAVGCLYAARLLGGLGLGGVSFAVHIYVAEISQPSIRGVLTTIAQVACNLGILCSYAVGAAGSYVALNAVCLAGPVVFLLVFVWMPESPQCLLSRGDEEGAARALQWLRGAGYDVRDELRSLKVAADEASKNEGSLRDAFTERVMVKALLISVGLIVAQQLGGVCVVFFYTQSIFSAAGSDLSDSLSSVVVGVALVIMAFVTTPIVDRVGRRPLLLLSCVVSAVSVFLLGLYFLLQDQMRAASWLPLACVLVFICVYCVGLGALPWVVMSEVLPPGVKGPAGSVVSVACWATTFLLTNTFQLFVDAAGLFAVFWFFAGATLLSTVFVYFVVPETKGLTLQEIQDKLSNRHG